MLKLFIETDNAAFDNQPATELARILRALAKKIETDPARYHVLRDINGNKVGECTISEPAED